MATLHPSRDELAKLPGQGLTAGEWAVLGRLEAALEDDWHVWAQPRLVGAMPDFVIAHRRHGIVVMEVKDWTDGLYRAQNGGFAVRDDAGWQRIAEDPLAQADRYRSVIHQLYLITPSRHISFSIVRGVVVMTAMPREAAEVLLRSGTRLPTDDAGWIHVEGQEFVDRLDPGPVRRVFGRRDVWHGGEAFDRLVNRLTECQAVQDERRPLLLSPGARDVERNPNAARLRRVRGPAGSGKTVGLAARAARLAAADQTVLVVTYNITLGHYIQGLLRRHCRTIGADHRQITVTNIHRFAANILRSHGRQVADVDAIIDQARQLYEERQGAGLPSFNSVLVDEGQDFTLDWWNFLREWVWRPAGRDGEMLLAADATQDLYERKTWTDPASQPDAGFSGPWTRLAGTYRNTPDLIRVLNRFAETYLPESDRPTLPDDHPQGLATTVRNWVDIRPDQTVRMAVRALKGLHDRGEVVDGDVLFMAQTHETGVRIADGLAAADIPVEHVFDLDEETRQMAKRAFWPGRPSMKAATIHSAKGWESPTVVLLLEPSDRVAVEAYIGMTRTGMFADGVASSFLLVLNSAPELRGFKDAFEA